MAAAVRVPDEPLTLRARELRAAGLSTPRIARELGVSRGSVEYRLLSAEERTARGRQRALNARRRNAERRLVVCPQCGDDRYVVLDTWYRIETGKRSGMCSSRCVSLHRRGVPPETGAWVPELGREELLEWARGALAAMSPAERFAVASIDVSVQFGRAA